MARVSNSPAVRIQTDKASEGNWYPPEPATGMGSVGSHQYDGSPGRGRGSNQKRNSSSPAPPAYPESKQRSYRCQGLQPRSGAYAPLTSITTLRLPCCCAGGAGGYDMVGVLVHYEPLQRAA